MTINCQIDLHTEITRTPRVQQLEGIFDVPPAQRSVRTWQHHFTLPETWNVGVIVGPSGSGKSTLARRAFGEHLIDHWTWPDDKSILDGFPQSLGIREITGLLCSVGFSSPPSWVRPFHALSNGEQFRVNLARTLSESQLAPGDSPGANADRVARANEGRIAVVDEFTSVVDRTAARIGSAAVAKAVRRRNQKFIAVTCHYDVLDWLEPDWVYEPHLTSLSSLARHDYMPGNVESNDSPPTVRTNDPPPKIGPNAVPPDVACRESRQANPAEAGRWLRPPIELEIIRAHSSCWPLFSPHHYLSGNLHPSSKCFVALFENRPAAFVAALPFPHPTRSGWREHRCVCLPDFQGVGIGNALSEFVAGTMKGQGHVYRSTTSHPGMIQHRAHSPLWKMIRRPSLCGRHRGIRSSWIASSDRLTAGFEYVGPSLAAACL